MTNLTWNELLERAGIATVETGRTNGYGRPEKALTNGVVCILRPDVSKVADACRLHFGIDLLAA